MEEVVAQHTGIIDPCLKPHLPSVEEIETAIAQTGNSATGPDGIPFSAYRKISQFAAPILHRVFKALARGDPPPCGFNLGHLLLLPKRDTGLVADTRPLGVNNSDNRILARAMVNSILPAVESLAGPEHQAFIPGRLGEKHMRQVICSL